MIDFEDKIQFLRGGNVNPNFQYVYNNWLNQLVTNEVV